MSSDLRTFKQRQADLHKHEVQSLPYGARRKRADGGCKRCLKIDIPVIESVLGGWLCWNLGYCQVRRPFPSTPWNPPPGSLKGVGA